ncbi:MAG TPA: hypothetical protein VGC57_10875 [Cellulomonas sp.]
MNRPEMPAFTAWDSRLANEDLLHRTAEMLGGDWVPEEGVSWGDGACELPDGGVGRVYELRGIETGPVDDPDAARERVRELWTGWGLSPNDRALDTVRILTATNPKDRASLVFMAGPGGTGLIGDSGCAVTHGRPADEPFSPTAAPTP